MNLKDWRDGERGHRLALAGAAPAVAHVRGLERHLHAIGCEDDGRRRGGRLPSHARASGGARRAWVRLSVRGSEAWAYSVPAKRRAAVAVTDS